MKKRHVNILISGLIILATGLPSTVWGQSQNPPSLPSAGSSAITASASASPTPPVYRPPLRGMPFSREGGATRGLDSKSIKITALVPEHTALTTQSQPCLFYHLSQSVDAPVEVTIIDDNAVEPLWQTLIAPPVSAGIHNFCMKDGGYRLESGKVYKWFVAIVADPEHRSRDIVAGGAIERILVSESLEDRLKKATLPDQISIYADTGIWYDALSTIQQLIESQPDSKQAMMMRTQFLNQVGLKIEE